MLNWFDELIFGRRRQLERRIMNLEAEIARLQEELNRKSALQQSIAEDDARSREREVSRVQAAEVAGLRSLLEPIAPALAQLASARQGDTGATIPMDAQVVEGLLGPLQEQGLTLHGEVGKPVRFDPNRFEFIGEGSHPTAGETVELCRVGLSFQGSRLLRAQVIRMEENR